MLERLQKIIARAGIASRRHAEELILSGSVTLNGKVVTELGTKADPARDHIRVGSRLIQPAKAEAPRYFIFHKPAKVVATMHDPEHRPCLHGYLQHIPGRIFPVGRLEFAGSGLLLLTSDGELASKLLRAAASVAQTYRLKLNGPLSPESLRRVEDFARAQLRLVREAPNPWYEACLAGAARDRLRRALAEEKLHVEKFVRTGFAGLELGDLPAGAYRPLTVDEIRRLQRCAGGASDEPRAKHLPAAATLRAAMEAAEGARAQFPHHGRPRNRRNSKRQRPAAVRNTKSISKGPALE